MTETIQILIADSHAIVRTGLRTLIASEPGMAVVGEAADSIKAVLKTRSLQPDVIVFDIDMPRQDGLWAITQIRNEYPDARILVLTTASENRQIAAAMEVGVLGYWLKMIEPDQLLKVIRQIYAGETTLDPAIVRQLSRQFNHRSSQPSVDDPLTEREIDVLRLLAQGLTNREIATTLTIGNRTVGNHIGQILSKLHLRNRTQATLYALRQGLVSLAPEPNFDEVM